MPKTRGRAPWTTAWDAKTWLELINVVVLTGACGQYFAWRRDRHEAMELALKQNDDARQSREERRDIVRDALQRQEQLAKLTRDALYQIAINVADRYYRPLLDATARTEMHLGTFERWYDVVRGTDEFLRTGRMPEALGHDVRIEIEELAEKWKHESVAIRQARATEQDAGPIYKFYETILKTQTRAVVANFKVFGAAATQFLNSGYLTELLVQEPRDDADYKTNKLVKNLITTGDFRLIELLPDDNPETARHTIASLRNSVLDPLSDLRKLMPWEKFCVRYRDKLRVALGG